MTLAVYSKTCSKNVSGNTKIFIAEQANVSAITVTAGEISGITSTAGFKEIDVDLDSIIRTEEKINGKLNYAFDVSIEMKLVRPSVDLNTLRTSLGDASPCGMLVIIRDNNGTYWLVGYNELDLLTRPLYLSQDNMTSGAELIDLEGNKASLQLLRSLADPSLPLDATLAAAIDAETATFCAYATGYCVEFQAVYDSWSVKPGDTLAAAMNNMVAGLVADGVWSKLDVFYLFAAHAATEALTNWILPGTRDATNIHATAFAALEGYTGDGANDHLLTNYNPTDHGVNYLLDSASFGYYMRNIGTTGNAMGVNQSYPAVATTGSGNFKLNDTTWDDPVGPAIVAGLHAYTRTSSANRDVFINKTKYTSTIASVGIPLSGAGFAVLAYNNAGSPANFSDGQCAMAFVGGGMTQGNVDGLTDRVEAYMDGNGKGVIT